MMKTLYQILIATMVLVYSATSNAFSVWLVDNGADPFSNGMAALSLNEGTNTLDVYYDTGGDTSYGYDIILDVVGSGSVTGLGGGDSDLGDIFGGSGWRQFGGSVYGTTGGPNLAFSLDFNAVAGTSLFLSAGSSYTDINFLDGSMESGLLASVSDGDLSPVPVPAAIWLFGSGLIGLIGVARRKR